MNPKKSSPKTKKRASPKIKKRASPKIKKRASPKTKKRASPKTKKRASPKTKKRASPKTKKRASPKTKKRDSVKNRKIKKILKGGADVFDPIMAEEIMKLIDEKKDENQDKIDNLCNKLVEKTEYEEQYKQLRANPDKKEEDRKYMALNLCKTMALNTLKQKSPVASPTQVIKIDRLIPTPAKKSWWNIF